MKNIEKAAQIIKLLVLDVDGVMTDGSIYLDAEQELFKSFNAKDGMGISCAIRCGLQVAIITGRCSPIIRRRARELGIVEVCENVKEKRSALAELLQKYNLPSDTTYEAEEIYRFALHDKKRAGQNLTLVLPNCLGKSVLYPLKAEELAGFIKDGISYGKEN